MFYSTSTPYAANYVILRKEGKIAFVLRSNTLWMNGYYGLPSGKTEKHESSSAGAVREALEEAGVTIKSEDLRFVHAMHRHAQDNDNDWIDIYFEVLNYEGEPYNAEPHMHSELTWLDPNNLPDNVIPSTALAIKNIQAGEMYTEYGWS